MRVEESIAALAKAGRAADASLLKASAGAMRGKRDEAVASLGRLLTEAPPGQTGWIVPIDPSLAPLRWCQGFQSVLAMLSARAA